MRPSWSAAWRSPADAARWLGVLCGVALLGTIGSALVFLGAEAYWEKALQGGIILIAVASDAFEFKRRRHAQRALAHE